MILEEKIYPLFVSLEDSDDAVESPDETEDGDSEEVEETDDDLSDEEEDDNLEE